MRSIEKEERGRNWGKRKNRTFKERMTLRLGGVKKTGKKSLTKSPLDKGKEGRRIIILKKNKMKRKRR